MKPIICDETTVNKGLFIRKCLTEFERNNPTRKLHIVIVSCTYAPEYFVSKYIQLSLTFAQIYIRVLNLKYTP